MQESASFEFPSLTHNSSKQSTKEMVVDKPSMLVSHSSDNEGMLDHVTGMQEWRLAESVGQVPCARCWFAWTSTPNSLIIGGGYDGKKSTSSFLNDLVSLDLDTFMWNTIPQKGDLPPPRYAHTITYSPPNNIVLFGGAAGKIYFDSFFVFDMETNRWQQLFPSSKSKISPRCAHGAVRVDKLLFIYGGDSGGGVYLDDLWALDIVSHNLLEFDRTSTINPLPRGWHTLNSCGDKLFIFGGCNESRKEKILNDLWFLSLDIPNRTASWSQAITSKDPRHSHASVCVGNEILILGGKFTDQTQRPIEVHWYNSDLKMWWYPDIKGQIPTSRFAHCAVYYKGKIIVFGGCETGGKIQGNQVMPTSADVSILEISAHPHSRALKRGAPQLPSDLLTLVNNENFSDVCFLVEGKKLFGHRNILASRSSYFKTMFLGSEKVKMKEANQEEIPIGNVTYLAFLALLRYLYTETLPGEDIEVLLDLLALANLHQFDKLKGDLSYLIERHVSIENCSLLFQHAHHNLAQDLKKVCLEFMLKNYEAIQATSGYSQLEDELIAEILQQKLNRD